MILGLVNRYLNKFKPQAETRKRSGFSNESGNVFFTLFGAVALVGVVGVATSTLMRGPVGTVVQLNQRAKADAQMQIAQKLAMLEAAQQAQSGDCDADGFVEPIGAKTVCTGPTPSGGGCIPDAIGASKTDPWGTNYGYCSWDHGGVIGSGCATNSTGILDGTNDDAEIVIAIISAGPDRTFNSTCANHNTYVTKTPGSDDIVLDITYSGAVEASGGMWYLQSGDPDTAGIDKNIYVSGSGDFEGGGRFGAGIQMDSGAFDMQLGSYLLLPTQATSGACDSSTNKGALRRFVQGDDTEILEICDSANLGWTNVANAGAGSGAQGPAGALQLSDGATPTGFMYTSALSYTGGVLSTDGFNATGNAAINGTLSVDGNIDDPTGDVIIDDALNVTGNTDVDGTFNVDGTTTLAGTTVTSLNATGAVDFDNTLNVDGASTLAGTTVTTLGVSGASNFQGPASFGAAIFNSAGNLDLNDDVDITGNTTISGNAEISGDVFGAAFRNMYDGQDEGLFFDSANGLFLGVNGSPALSVDASGDVGINISGSPTAQLDIEGELRLRSSASYAAGAGCSAPGMIAYNGADELLICSSITGLWETVGTSGGGGGSAGGVWDDEGDYIKYENGTYITNAGTSLTFSSALEGPGTRMLWYTSQGAFRVGSVTGSQWNETNIGQNSVAFGIDTISDGTASFVAGDSSQATSSSAIALGSEVEARAPSSIALGNEAIVSAGATNSMAIGLGLPSTSTNPQVLSPNSLGIFMGDQQGVSLNTTNTMLLAGGRLVIDPDTTSATNIAPSNLLTVDVEGQVGATQYCDEDGLYCFLAADVAGGATPAPGADTEVLFNSGGILGADPSFVFYRSTGNLGLGVTDPEAQIHLSEQLLLGNINDCTAATQGALRLSVSGDVIEMCDFAGAGGYVAIGGASVAAPGSDRELIFNSGGLLAADANLSFTSSGVLQVVRNATTQAIDITGGIRITSDISNLADFQMNSNGLLAAESNMYFNIDSDNDVTTNAFIFGHNANTSAATELMRLQENGRLGLGVTTPQTRMDVDGTLKIAFGNEACDAAREGALHFNSSDNNFYVCQTNGNGWQRIITAGGGGGGLPAAGADRQIQFNSGNELAADANFVFTSAGNMGIGTANPTSKLYIFENYTADGYKTAMSVEMDTSGSASAYRGVVGLQTTAINDATGAGFKEAYGLYTVGRAGNDASAQTAIGVASRVDVHAGDTGMIYSATDDGSSTGGSQYAMYINLDDADVNSYGIYQQSNNPNALFGTLGIGTQTPSSQLHLYRSGGNASALIEGDENNSSDVTLLTSGDGASTVGDATATGWSLSARGNAFATATVQNDLMYYYWNGAAYQQRFLLENDTGNLVLSDTDVVGDTKLDVDGTLKIAYGNEACDAAREGAIHFDSSDNNFYVCPASGSWQRVITAGGGGTPAGGNDREIQFNSGSSLAGATNFVYTPEGDFIVGAYQIDDTGTGSEDSRMYFDVSNSAFRAGRAQSGQWNFASAGQYSAAFGNNTAATAMSSFATGFNTVAGGSHSVAMGSSSNASGIASVAMGQGSVASGNYSIALGNSANATQTGSISLGNTDSVGVNSFAAGDLVQASGNYSTAIGKSAIAAGSNSMALGLSTGTVANRPSVSGANSLGIFIGSQNNINFSSSDTMGIFGGAVVIDPQQPATNLSADTALEIEGTLKIAYGNEACDASRIGAIHFDSSAERFFVCQNAGEGWVNIATNNATAADPQRGIQFKSGDNLAASNNFVYTPEGDFIVGSSQIDDTGTGSEDSRMYFDVSNSAFRAGSVADARWDYTSAGQYSFATGDNTMASGASSFAAGGYTQATGYAATAFGSGANATGNYSFAVGDTSIAGGDYSAAFGSSDAMGMFSFAANTATANGDYSVAFGNGATALADDSVAIGNGSSATSAYSVALGGGTASNSYAVAIGDGVTASGANSLALGGNTTASGDYAATLGYATNAAGFAAVAMGRQVSAFGDESIALGTYTSAGNNAMAIGLMSTNPATDPQVSGQQSLGIFMGNQNAVDLSSANTMALFGGSLVIDPRIPAVKSFADTALDVYGTLKIANGGESCSAAADGGMIRWNGAAMQYCDGSAWQNFASGASASPGAPDRGIQFNSGGAFTADTNFIYTSEGDFIVGSSQIDDTGTGSEDSRMYFDVSNSAFRAGSVADARWDFTSAGQYSFAGGNDNEASGLASAAFGSGNLVRGDYSFGMGQNNEVDGNYAVAIGNNNYAMANSSVALGGMFAAAYGQGSIAAGTGVTANGDRSVSLGDNTVTYGQASVALGMGAVAGGDQSVAIGSYASAGAYSMAVGLMSSNPATDPQVSGQQSLGIFMGNQNAVDLSSANTMALFGGSLVIDPRIPAVKSSADTALDVYGTLKIADGGESCSAAADGGMIRWNGATMQYCDGAAWQNFASGAVASPGAPDRGLQFNSGGSFAASNELVFTSAGNLGLGTATPTNFGVSTYSRVFHIKSDGPNGDAELVLDAGDNSLGAHPLLTFALDGTPVGYIRSQKSQTGVTDGGMTFHTHDGLGISEAMRLTPDGNLAVGLTYSSAKLNVGGTIKIADGGETCTIAADGGMVRWNGATMQYCDGAAWQNFASGAVASPGAPNRGIQFNSGGSFSADANFVYTSTGYLGLGVASPASRLHLDVPAPGLGTDIANLNVGTAGIRITEGPNEMLLDSNTLITQGSNMLFGVSGEHDIVFYTSATSQMRLTDQGRLGIGTDTPAVNLDLVSPNSTVLALTGDETSGLSAALAIYTSRPVGDEGFGVLSGNPSGGNTGWMFYGVGESASSANLQGDLALRYFDGASNAGEPVMNIDKGGDVLIGNQLLRSARTKLEVDGTLKIAYGNEACDADREGAIRFDSGANTFSFCADSGTGWESVSLGLGGAGAPDRGIQFNSGGNFAADANLTYTSAGDFIVGSSQINDTGSASNDSRMYFDASSSAFRAGFVDGAQWDYTSAGSFSAAFGYNNMVSADYGFAAGSINNVTGNYSAAFGSSHLVSGQYAMAMGSSNEATGDQSVAFGLDTLAEGLRSTAFGNYTFARGDQSTTMGNFTTASGFNSTAIGYDVTAGDGSGLTSTPATFADRNTPGLGNYSIAFGLGDAATANNPMVSGNRSMGVFFGQQDNTNVSAEQVLAIVGGNLVLRSGSGMNVAAAATQLDMDGTIKIAYGGEACDAAREGAIRFDSGANTFSFCADSGTGWESVALGLGGAGAPDRGIQFNSGGNFAASSNLVYTSAGRLGVGSNTPEAILDVVYNGNAEERTMWVSSSPTLSASNPSIAGYENAYFDTTVAINNRAVTEDVTGISNNTYAAALGGSGSVSNLYGIKSTLSSSEITGGSVANAYGLYLENTVQAADSFVIYSSGGKNFFDGSVGIGQTSPATQLDVDGTLKIAYGNESCDAAREGAIRFDSAANTFSFCADDASGWEAVALGLGGAGAPDRGIQFNSGGNFTASSNLVYTSAGNLGIGTATPVLSSATRELTLSATGANELVFMNLQGNEAVDNVASGLGFYNDSAIIGYIESRVKTNTSSGALAFGTVMNGTPTEVLRLSQFGAMGVGTVAPQTQLDVDGTLKIAYDGEACDAAREGAIRFDSAANAFSFCADQGNDWEVVSLGSGVNEIDDLTDGHANYSSSNIFLGQNSGNGTLSGGENVALGPDTLTALTSGYGNTALGAGAAPAMQDGYQNTVVGSTALYFSSNSYDNAIFGYGAAQSTTGNENTALGTWALYGQGSGGRNTAVGFEAARSSSTVNFSNVTVLGYRAGENMSDGADNNTLIGYQAGSTIVSGSDNILLGYNVDVPADDASNYLNIGDVFYGSMGTGELYIGGNGALRLPSGDNTTRPGTLAGTTAINGMIRYNSTSGRFEGYQADSWQDILTGSAIAGLNDLTDVDTTGVSDQDVLTYDSASGTWVPAAVSTDFIGLTDTPATYTGQGGRFARVNSGETAIEFTDQIIETVTGEPAPDALDLNDLGDVNTSPSDGQFLSYDSNSGSWIAVDIGSQGGLWTAGSGDDIYYNSGSPRVGVGLTTPQTLLDIDGTFKLAYGGENCDASREGSIRYDSASDSFAFCAAAGNGWETVSLGSGTLAALSDTDLTGVSDNEVLTYNSATGNWEPAAVSADFVSLTDTPASYSGQGGRFARVNSGETAIEFTDQLIDTVSGAPAPASFDLNDLGDVSASPAGGQALIYDSASGVWVAGTVGGGSVGAAGSDREIQFNSGGNMATASGFVFTSAGLGVGTAVPSDSITIAGDNQDMSMYSYSTSGALSGADINFWRSRGTEAAPFSAVNSGDKIGGLRFYGSTNSNWVSAAQISVMTSATAGSWTSGTERKADIVFETINGFGNYGERMRIHSDGTVRFISTGAIVLPVGTDAQRPTGEAGMLRYSSTSNTVEYFNGTIWESFATSAGSVSTAGAEGDLQFNSGGELGAVSGLNFNVASGTLSVDSIVNIGGTTGLAAPVGAVAAGSGGGGSTTFTGLSDTPANYTGAAGQMVVVNSGATGLEFVDAADAGVWTDSGSGYIEYSSALGSMRVASVTGAAAPAGAVAVSNATSLLALTDTNISSVSSGQILSYDGSQWVNVNANSAGLWSSAGGDSIFYNSGTPTVGIGTATPAVELDVAGDINLTGMLMMGQIAGDAPTYMSASNAVGALNDLTDVDTAGVVDGEVLLYSAGSGGWVTGVASGTGLWTDAGGYIEYNSSYGGMKVGSVASVSAPTGMSLNALSDVLAGSPSTNDVLSWNGTNWVPSASAGGGGGDSLWTAGSGDTIYYNSGSFRVGVGTASPANELDVVGDIRVSNSVIFAPVSGMSAPVYMSAGGSGAGASALDDLTDVDTTGVVNGEVLTYSAGNWVSSAVPDTNIWSDSGSGYIEYDVSYGGIRVASVSGASMPPTGAVVSGGSAISILNDLTDVTTTGVADGEVLMYSAGSGSWVTGTASGSSLWAAGSGDSIYYTSGSPTVGIGTASPAAELDVVGDIRVSNSIIIQPVSGLSAPTFISASGSSTALGGLADVDVSGVSDGQVLMYSAGSGNWVAGSGGGGGGAVNDLSDATTDYANANMFIGSGSGAGTTTAQNNTAVGYNALASNDVSNYATAFGAYAAENYDATNQWQAIVAVGSEAARNLTQGSGITAIGNEALESFPGDRNTAIGSIAMFASNGGGGNDNVGVGDGAGSYMAGGNNVVVGSSAFRGGFGGDYDHGGNNNVFIGSRSARDVQGSTTSNNVMLGYQTGLSLRNGSSNIIIGANVDVSGANAANEMNIGNVIYGSGMYNAGAHIGINNSTPDVALDVTGDIEYTGTLTDVSDMRLKKDIAPLDAKEIIGRLSQVDTYSFRMINDEKGQLELGVMAQEVEKVFPELVRTANDEMGTKSVNYVGFIAPLIEASKELKSENDALRAEITEMKLAQAEFKDDIMREVNGLKAHTGYGIDKAQIGLWTIALLFGFSSIFFMVGGILRHRQHKQG